MSAGSQNFRASGHLAAFGGLLYPELVASALVELTPQISNVWNAASNGALVLTSDVHPGDYKSMSRYLNHGGLVGRRDVGSSSPGNDAISATRLNRGEQIAVKLNESVYIEDTFDALAKTFGNTPADVTAALAEELAKDRILYKLNRALYAATGAIRNVSDVFIDIGGAVSPQRTLTTNDLVDTLAQFGDNAGEIVAWVMHSKVYFDLVKSQIAANITNISDFNVREASPVTLGRPVIVTDSPALVNTSSPGELTEYTTLGLRRGAVTASESEAFELDVQTVHGNENVLFSIQNKTGAFTLELAGYTWDITNGGINPIDSVLATGSNWDRLLAVKNTAGVAIQSL